MIVAIINQKGGVSKTTLSINLARYFSNSGSSTLLIDSDPQGSARDWHAQSDGTILNVIALDRPTLHRDIKNLKYEYEWIFIDGANAITAMAVSAVRCSDIILIPVQPSPMDLWATEDMVEIVKDGILSSDGKKKAAFIISRQKPNTKISIEIKDILREFDLPVFNSVTSDRVLYAVSAAKGLTVLDYPDNQAASEIKSIGHELKEFANE